MVDVRGDVLRPPHCTTPAAVKTNKNHSINVIKSNNSLMCPLNNDIFYLNERATPQEEYFLKHDHCYDTINTSLSL